MAERRGFVQDHTNRPDRVGAGSSGAGSSVLPTIADVLALDVVTAASPEILVGEDRLRTPVRWVHVTETESVAGLVSGGEMLLSTGVGWPHSESALDGYVTELERAGVAALALELGVRYSSAPKLLVRACEVHSIPLIVFRKQARFIAITEAVHSRIITDQMNALRARDEIHALFTELSLRGSPADFIVEQLGSVLGAPVVLEDLSHRVIAARLSDDGDSLADWEQTSRAAHRAAVPGLAVPGGASDADGWLIVPVEARGTRWGHLLALPGRAHPAGRRNVLEQAAVALALSRLADRDADEWVLQSQQALLAALLGGRYHSESGLRARFEASGLAIVGRRLYGLALTEDSSRGRSEVAAAVRAAAKSVGADAVVGTAPDLVETGASRRLVVALSVRDPLRDAALKAFGTALESRAPHGRVGIALAVGNEAGDVQGLLASIDEATRLLGTDSRTPVRSAGVNITRAEDKPLLRLMTSFAGDPRLQAHSEAMLRPLIEHDLANSGDLLDVLRAYAAHPGNRTRAAAASHLSRSVFYQRIALIESLLGADLDDGETLSALHAALLARR